MNKEVWYRMLENWIKSYDSIIQLENQGIITEDESITTREKLLLDIIKTFKKEIKDE